MSTRRQEFEAIWWAMEEIEPLTPVTVRYEDHEVPVTVRQTKEEGLLQTECDIL